MATRNRKASVAAVEKTSPPAATLSDLQAPKKGKSKKLMGPTRGRRSAGYGISSLIGAGQHRRVLASRFLEDSVCRVREQPKSTQSQQTLFSNNYVHPEGRRERRSR